MNTDSKQEILHTECSYLIIYYRKIDYHVQLINRVAESRKEAMASIDLMLERFSRIRSEEQSKNGLVIVAAIYGKVVDGK